MVREIAATPYVEPQGHQEVEMPLARAPGSVEFEATLARSISRVLGDYLRGRRLVKVKIRLVEGNRIDGFLKIAGVKGERLLVDFEATAPPQGGLTSLKVDGRKVPLEPAATKQPRRY